MTKLQYLGLSLSLIAFALVAYALAPVLSPFVIAVLLAYLGNPLTNTLQRWHLPRTVAVVVVFLLTFIVLALFIGLLIPSIEDQVSLLVNKIPLLIQFWQTTGSDHLAKLLQRLSLSAYLQTDTLQNFAGQHWQQAGHYLNVLFTTVSHSGAAIFAWVVNLLLIPVVTFYLLRDWHALLANCEALLPRRIAPLATRLLSQCNDVLGAFFKGQLLVMLALAVIYTVGLSIVGLQLALLIGLIAGLLSIVPYLGFSIGLICALLTAAIQFPDRIHMLYVLIVFIIGNALEGMVLTPCLVGDKIGLHPVAVIFAILAGGQLFGFSGILLALPVAAVLMVLLRHLHQSYLNGQWYQ